MNKADVVFVSVPTPSNPDGSCNTSIVESVVSQIKDGKIVVDADLTTTKPHIFAIGDVCKGSPELTPVAIREGIFLVDRLFGGVTKRMNYEFIPTTIFTPLEYSAMGLSEEKAIERLGQENVEV